MGTNAAGRLGWWVDHPTGRRRGRRGGRGADPAGPWGGGLGQVPATPSAGILRSRASSSARQTRPSDRKAPTVSFDRFDDIGREGKLVFLLAPYRIEMLGCFLRCPDDKCRREPRLDRKSVV